MPIQLVVQSNDYQFVDGDFLKEGSFNLLFAKLYRGPVKSRQIDKCGNVIVQLPKHGISSKEKVVQEIYVYSIDAHGTYLDTKDLQTWPARTYPRIRYLKTDQDISDFIRKTGFCDFPVEGEVVKEKKYYLSKFVPTETGIWRKNWLQIYRKLSILSEIIENAAHNKLTKQDIDFLLRQKKQNVLEIAVNRNDFAHRELKDPDARPKKSDFLNEYKAQKIQETNITIGYRVFGQFALCCLELLKDIENQLYPRFCRYQHCGKLLPMPSHGNTKYCSTECHRKQRTLDRKALRSGPALQTREKKKPIPKKNLR